MAEEWTPMRNDLRNDPAVITISIALTMDPDMVVGKLLRVWGWAGAHTTSGRMRQTSLDVVDFIAGAQGFASAMRVAGWLECDDSGSVVLPRFTKRNGSASKKRLLDARRASRNRATNVASKATKSAPTEQNITVFKKTPLKPPQGGAELSSTSGRNRNGKHRTRSLTPDEAVAASRGEITS